MSKTDNRYWFKRRRYGYGWTPVTWQGWLSLILCIGAVIGSAFLLAAFPITNESVWLYVNTIIIIIVLVTIIGLLKGPRPRWRWGKKPGDNSKEDF